MEIIEDSTIRTMYKPLAVAREDESHIAAIKARQLRAENARRHAAAMVRKEV